jgi:hypothetical protein
VTKQIYVGSEEMASMRINKPPTKENGVTCSGEKCAEYGHQPTAFVLVTEIGGNDTENEGTRIWRHLIMNVSPARPLTGSGCNERTINNCVRSGEYPSEEMTIGVLL